MKLWTCLWLLCWMPALRAQVSPAHEWAVQAERWIFNDERLPEALDLNRRARRAFRQADDQLGVVQTDLNEAAALNQQSAFKAADRLLQRIDPAVLPPRSALWGRYLLIHAWTTWALGDYATALAEADSAQVYLLEEEDRVGAAYAALISTYAVYFENKNAYQNIDQRLARVYGLARGHLPKTHLLYRYLYQLHGAVLLYQGHLSEAIASHLEGLRRERVALTDHPNTRDSVRLSQYLQFLGQLYAEQGSVEQSTAYYEQAFHTYRALGKIGQQLKLCVRLSQLHRRRGQALKARSYSARLPDLLQRYTAPPSVQRRTGVYAHLSQAYYYQQTRQPQALLDYYRRTLLTIEQADLAPHKAHQHIAAAHAALEQYDEAEAAYRRSLAYLRRRYGDHNLQTAALYHALTLLAQRQQRPARVQAYLDSALHQLAPLDESRQGFDPEGYLDKKRAAQLYQLRAQRTLAEGRYAAASQDLDRALALQHYARQHYLGDASKMLSAQQLRPLYEAAALSAWRQYQRAPSTDLQQRLFGFTERSRGTALQENLLKFRNQHSHGGETVPKDLLEQEEALMVQLGRYKEQLLAAQRAQRKALTDYYQARIFESLESLRALERRLRTNYPHYQSWRSLPDATQTLQQVQATLLPDQVLLEYLITDSLCLVWYVTADAVAVVDVPNYQPGRFSKEIALLRQGLSDVYETERDSAFSDRWATAAADFYQQYVHHPLLNDKTALIVVPDGQLYYIPFEVLLTEHSRPSAPYSELPYLLRRCAVHYHYSADLLLYAMQHRPLPSGKVLGFAASYGAHHQYEALPLILRQERSVEEVHTHNSCPPIPGALEELERLAAHYTGRYHRHHFANERTLKEQFDDPQYGVVHLAMHGMVDYQEPSYSSLIFTENLDSLEDNLLYAYEVQHLQGQRVNLVVLSACKTGYGRYAQGEGIISLGRSFIQAGVPSVVMTLWELNDETTTRIMALFYEGLADGLPKNEALRQAKLDYLTNHRDLSAHPFFWASAICIGNPTAIPVERRHRPWMVVLLLSGLALGSVLTWKYLSH